MPQLGETVAEGKIVKWFKAAGDAVKPGDNLFEIETDKTSMEVPATSAGTLSEIRFQVGEVAKVGAVVAIISGAGETAKTASAALAAKAPAAPKSAPASAAPAANGRRAGRLSAVRPDGPLPRSAHAGAQFRARQAGGRHLHHAAGAPAGRRTRHRSVARFGFRPAWPHRCRRRREGRARRCRSRNGARAPARRRSRRCSRASPTRKCRSIPCAAPSRRG